MIYKGGHTMKKLILEILNLQYKEWIICAIPIILSAIGAIIKTIKKNINKRKSKKILPWIGKIDGIDKNNIKNMHL